MIHHRHLIPICPNTLVKRLVEGHFRVLTQGSGDALELECANNGICEITKFDLSSNECADNVWHAVGCLNERLNINVASNDVTDCIRLTTRLQLYYESLGDCECFFL
jgi:hypothetical protein